MNIIGSNVNTETKDATVTHRNKRFQINLLTTKRGIVIDIAHGKIVKNGTSFMIVEDKEEIQEFEKEIEAISL
jgi:hypothetical protein